MKYLKMLGIAAVAAMSFMAFAASASATTLEIGGVTQNGAVTLTASLESNTTVVLARTDGTLANTCTGSHVHGETSVFTGTYVTGPLTGHTAHQKSTGQLPTDGLSFSGCTRPVTVHDPGTLYIDHESGTTSGTVFSEDADVTVSTVFGTVRCQTGAGTHIGTMTGVASGHATMKVDAVLNCGFLLPSATWKGSYEITSPTGLGVSA